MSREDHCARWQGHHFLVDGALTVAVDRVQPEFCVVDTGREERARPQRDLGDDA